MFKNFGFPTAYQWKRLAIHAVGAFLSGFGGYLILAGASLGEPSLLLTLDTVLGIFWGAITAGLASVYNFILYTFEAPQK